MTTLLGVRTSSGFFEASCIVCGLYRPVFAFESRLNGVTEIEYRFCEDHASFTGVNCPIGVDCHIWRHCEACGRERCVREHPSCQFCGCGDLRSVPWRSVVATAPETAMPDPIEEFDRRIGPVKRRIRKLETPCSTPP